MHLPDNVLQCRSVHLFWAETRQECLEESAPLQYTACSTALQMWGGGVQCRSVFVTTFVTELGDGGNVEGMRWGITGFSRSTFDLGFNPPFFILFPHLLWEIILIRCSVLYLCCSMHLYCTCIDLQYSALQRILSFHFHHQIRFQFGSTTSILSFAIIELLSSSLNKNLLVLKDPRTKTPGHPLHRLSMKV